MNARVVLRKNSKHASVTASQSPVRMYRPIAPPSERVLVGSVGRYQSETVSLGEGELLQSSPLGISKNCPWASLKSVEVLYISLDRKSTRLNSSHIPLSRIP